MKTLTKAVAAASLATVSVAAFAETSLTVGGVSDYYFRGVNLGDAGAYASVDYENSGFYAGVWAIDDGGTTPGNDGLETDFYLGYAGEVEGFSYGIGFTRYEYTYTSDFEQEINLSAGIAGFSLDLAFGTDDNEDSGAGTDQDYTVIQLSYSNGPWGITIGDGDLDETNATSFDDASYNWIEASYSAEVGGFDVTAILGQGFNAEMGNGSSPGTVEMTSAGNNYMVLDLSKSFDL